MESGPDEREFLTDGQRGGACGENRGDRIGPHGNGALRRRGIVAGVSQFNIEHGPVQAAGVPYFTLLGTTSGSFTLTVWVA
jgi:hypothetical protein